jgi:hypothetical protein
MGEPSWFLIIIFLGVLLVGEMQEMGKINSEMKDATRIKESFFF